MKLAQGEAWKILDLDGGRCIHSGEPGIFQRRKRGWVSKNSSTFISYMFVQTVTKHSFIKNWNIEILMKTLMGTLS